MSKRIVIALGGNALGNTAAQQLELVSLTAKPIVDLYRRRGRRHQVGYALPGVWRHESGLYRLPSAKCHRQ